ncbi:MAG TPA: NADH:flavin oxidoreductase/NADH oxidase [Pseudolysinimonas sp.]|nr:NADH:flavin oxidoreductase/NADH oxidase [Pseudolysinimonas sp.]
MRSISIRNRIWVSPMCQYSCEARDGVPTNWHLVHLGQFAIGGAGLVTAEATAVSPEGRISPEDTGIWNDTQRDAWTKVAEFIRSQGAVPAIQLAHAGRKGSDYRLSDHRCGTTVPISDGGWTTVAPSAIAFPGFDTPVALDLAGIDKVVADFAAAARRSVVAGFDVVEIHAAHGYLIHEFLSPLSNSRDDEYGGSLENRARLLVRIVEAVRHEIGEDKGLFVRVSATDWAEGGWDQVQTATVAAWIRDAGADLIDVSTGGLVADVRIPVSEGYQVPFSEHIRSESGMPTAAVGLILTPEYAESVVASGRADAVSLGREMLRNPYFALQAADQLDVHVDYWPRQYRVVQKAKRRV